MNLILLHSIHLSSVYTQKELFSVNSNDISVKPSTTMKLQHLFPYKYSLEIFEFNEHAQSGYWGTPFSDLPALKAHYTEKVSLLYHYLSKSFHSTLRLKGRSFVS